MNVEMMNERCGGIQHEIQSGGIGLEFRGYRAEVRRLKNGSGGARFHAPGIPWRVCRSMASAMRQARRAIMGVARAEFADSAAA